MLGYIGPIPRDDCLVGAGCAARNAVALCDSAAAEFTRGRTSLAEYLCRTANEEVGKCVLLLEAHVLSGSARWDTLRWSEFWKEFRDHESKYRAAWAKTLRSAGAPDRQASVWYSPASPKPAGREHLFKKPKVPLLHTKEASLYVDYDPDLGGGRFISPLDLDADRYWAELWLQTTHAMAFMVAKHRLYAVEHITDADVAAAAQAV